MFYPAALVQSRELLQVCFSCSMPPCLVQTSFLIASLFIGCAAENKMVTSNSSLLPHSARILGGTTDILGQFPFLVYIESLLRDFVSTQSCGGVILNANHVLTAAQCVVLAASIKIVSGVMDPKDAAAQISFGRAIIHPKYKRNLQIHDVAIVRLLHPVFLSTGPVRSVRILKRTTAKLDNLILTTAGWGPADGSTTIQTTVRSVNLMQLPKNICNQLTAQTYIAYPAMTSCLDTEDGTKGFCYGDAGGPVMYHFPTEGQPTLVGILSQYQQCPNSLPMSYTRIGHYYSWIKKTVKYLD